MAVATIEGKVETKIIDNRKIILEMTPLEALTIRNVLGQISDPENLLQGPFSALYKIFNCCHSLEIYHCDKLDYGAKKKMEDWLETHSICNSGRII